MSKISSFLFLVIFLSGANAYRILGIFPHFGKSHFDIFQPIMEELSDRGHDVTVLSYFPQPNAGYKDLVLPTSLTKGGDIITFDMLTGGYQAKFREVFLLHEFARETCELALRSTPVRQLLSTPKNKKFDLVIIEAFNTDCYLGLIYRLGAPFIQISSSPLLSWFSERFGQIDNPSYISNTLMGFNDKMSFWERVINTVCLVQNKIVYNYWTLPDDNVFAKKAFGDDLPKLEDIANNASLILVNDHFSLLRPRPSVPGVINILGVHVVKKQRQKLSQNIEKWINESKDGVIYFSMGSMIKGHTFPEDKRKMFLRAFGRLKQRVLWKWENETMPFKPDNVMIQKWMPQFDILCHPNVKAFIAHGGLLGTTEAVHCGVPVVVMPQFGDQHTNAKALEAGGGGVILNFREADEEMVYNALKTVLDPEFNKKAKELSARFRDRPMSPMDTAIYWIEYVARHKGAHHMRTAAVGMPLYQYLLLDVFAFLGICLLTFMIVTIYITKLFWRLLTSLFSSGDKKQKVKKN